MSNLTILAIYTAMLVFDFAVLAGTCYLIAERGPAGRDSSQQHLVDPLAPAAPLSRRHLGAL